MREREREGRQLCDCWVFLRVVASFFSVGLSEQINEANENKVTFTRQPTYTAYSVCFEG